MSRKAIWCLIWTLGSSLGSANAGETLEAYEQRAFRKVPAAALRELDKGSLDDAAIGAILNMAEESLAVEPGIGLPEYLAVLEKGKSRYSSRRADVRLDLQREALLKWIPKEKQLGVDAVLAAIKRAEKLATTSLTDEFKRSAEIFALSILTRRKIASLDPDRLDPEWWYLAARAFAADGQKDSTFLERYLAFPDKKRLKHAKEARALLKKLNEDEG